MFEIIHNILFRFCLTFQPTTAGQFEKMTPEGIIIGHAYGITGVSTVTTTNRPGLCHPS